MNTHIHTLFVNAVFRLKYAYISYAVTNLFESSYMASVTQSCPTLCNTMDCSMPGLAVHHQLPEFAQTHVH